MGTTGKQKKRKYWSRRLLWFVAIYLVSMLAVILIAYLGRYLIGLVYG